ncbi:MAG: hypothetical protein HUK20_12990 [Fibrobacter sp.]|nr:hypothetical protein [Bacilli bacterium]MCF0225177.1 hypothetical protein [Fibrobacter sp.]
MLEYILTASAGLFAGFIAGFFAEKFFKKCEEKHILESTKILVQCFGEPMYSGIFTIDDVTNWVECKKDQIGNGAKIAVFRTSKKLVQSNCANIKISSDIDNYLVLMVIAASGEPKDTIMVRFEKTDDKLTKLLDDGAGIFVIEE